MKNFKTINLLGLMFTILVIISATAPTTTYKVNVDKSKVEWVGRKITGEHTGLIKMHSGTFKVSGKKAVGGQFKMDMNSITSTDLSGNSATKLVGHLKSDDFFATEKFPSSTFEITKIQALQNDNYQITGNLTIKDIKQEISFPATIKFKGNALVAVANSVKIDRTKFNIKYNSKSIFGDIGDRAIDDEFNLKLNLVAYK